jgi:hypothetical protein
MLLIWLVCVSVAGYAATQSMHEDYYKTGTLNWQNMGYYNKHAALFVNVDNEGVNSTYYWIGQTTEIAGLSHGDKVSIRLAYHETQCRYYVVDIVKLGGGAGEA